MSNNDKMQNTQLIWGFCDLFLDKSFDTSQLSFIESLGYNTIAFNTHVAEGSEEPKKKKKKHNSVEKKDYIPPPITIPEDIKASCKLNILQRVTIEFSESSIVHKLNQSENLKKYDIVAVLPKTLQAFQFASGTLDIDIITFEAQTKIPFKISRKLYRQAVERGLFFELMYGPAIRDSTSRRNIISTAHNYHAVGKSKNILLTSGAENNTHCRSVQDVINLGFILGLNSNQCLEVIRDNPQKLIVKTQGRRCGKFYMEISPVNVEDENKTVEE